MLEENDFSENDKNVQELQEIPRKLSIALTGLGIIMISVGLLSIVFYLVQFNLDMNTPNPRELQASTMIAFGTFLLIILHFPWSKMKFGDFELERAIQEQSQGYSMYIEKLKEELQKYKGLASPQKPTKIAGDHKYGKDPEVEHVEILEDEDEVKKLLLKFLSEWSSYGFTISRIINWGGNHKKYKTFQKLSSMELRLLADKLVREGKVRTRISSNGNVLYQIR